MKGLEKHIVDEILSGCEDLLTSAYITEEQKKLFSDTKIEIVEEFTENHIPVTFRAPLRVIKKNIGGFLERLSTLSVKGISKTAYKKIGLLEGIPVDSEEPYILLFAACIIEPRYAELSEYDLQIVIMDDDGEELREDDQDWIDNPKSSFIID